MAEFRRLPTQKELQQILFMQGLRPQSTQQILQQNLAPQTINPIPENVFQKIAGGAKIASDYVNRAGTAADVAKLFPGYTGQSQVTIPTGFNFAPKQTPTGEVTPGGLQTQRINVNELLKAIKPADVLGISGAERAYSDIGAGRAPKPMDVVDTLELGAGGVGAVKGISKVAKATKGLPVGMSIQDLSKINGPENTKNLFEYDWYHGSTGNIREFRKDLLGEATGASSAKEGFFFARDPKNPPIEMTQKSNDPKIIAMLKMSGMTDEEIAAMNTVSMKGHGAHTASGYAQLGGDREYREAMRLASIAEKKGNWDEYDKQMQIAENLAIDKNNQLQLLTAKHGEARDNMLSKIQDTWYSTPMSQKEAEASDAAFKKLMGYSWYNNPVQVDIVKKELVNKFGKDKAASAINAIDQYKSIVAQRLAAESNSGANVLPVALRYKNPMYYDFKGSAYRDQTYADLIEEAKAKGHDALILQNTYDPGAGTAKLIDVGVVFDPAQIRSKFAKFDPEKINSPDILAAGIPFGLLGSTQVEFPSRQENKPKK